MAEVYKLDIKGYKTELPIIRLPSGVAICFFNLHGDTLLTEHCGKQIAALADGCDVFLTAESKGLQLTHVAARECGMPRYAVARKSKKLYMQDGMEVAIQSSITTGKEQKLYLSKSDAELMKGKRVGIIDDVVSTGNSLVGLEQLVRDAGGTVYKKLFVLAEGNAAQRDDILYLATIPLR